MKDKEKRFMLIGFFIFGLLIIFDRFILKINSFIYIGVAIVAIICFLLSYFFEKKKGKKENVSK